MFTINIKFLKDNNACEEGIKWFLQQNKPEMTMQDLKEADCPKEYMTWVAERLYYAGEYWPDDRYHENILQALFAIDDAFYLYHAGLDWPNDRYNDAILQALAATGEAFYLYRAGLDWPDDRYNDAILQALAATGDVEYLSLADKYWKNKRTYKS